jgi:hypothetical protein
VAVDEGKPRGYAVGGLFGKDAGAVPLLVPEDGSPPPIPIIEAFIQNAVAVAVQESARARGATIKQLAAALDVGYTHLCHWLNGDRPLPLATTLAISQIYPGVGQALSDAIRVVAAADQARSTRAPEALASMTTLAAATGVTIATRTSSVQIGFSHAIPSVRGRVVELIREELPDLASVNADRVHVSIRAGDRIDAHGWVFEQHALLQVVMPPETDPSEVASHLRIQVRRPFDGDPRDADVEIAAR